MEQTKILLIDDEPDILEFLEYNLLKEGFKVVTAADGRRGLETPAAELVIDDGPFRERADALQWMLRGSSPSAYSRNPWNSPGPSRRALSSSALPSAP